MGRLTCGVPNGNGGAEPTAVCVTVTATTTVDSTKNSSLRNRDMTVRTSMIVVYNLKLSEDVRRGDSDGKQNALPEGKE